MKRSFFVVIKKSILYAVVISFMLLLSLCSQNTIPAAKESLKLCSENIIPSLFPYFVLSAFLIKTDFAKIAGRILAPVMKLIFGISGEGGVAFCIGMISGYPTGAKAVCDLYKAGFLKKHEAQKLLPYCNNSGPLFVIGAVGAGMLKNPHIGIFLYVIHIISAVITGIVLRFSMPQSASSSLLKKTIQRQKMSISSAFSESVKESVISVLYVCGFIVFFASICAPLSAIFKDGISSYMIKGVLEVTSGIKSIAQNCNHDIAISLISFLLGFGGICVFLQVMGIAKEAQLSLKNYILGKLHQGALSFVLCSFLIKKTSAVAVFNHHNIINFETGNIGAAITSVFVICAFYFFVLAIRKNFKKY